VSLKINRDPEIKLGVMRAKEKSNVTKKKYYYGTAALLHFVPLPRSDKNKKVVRMVPGTKLTTFHLYAKSSV